jgi:hypothetical protein
VLLQHQKFVRLSVTRIYCTETVYEGKQFDFSAVTINQTIGRKHVAVQRLAARWTPRDSNSVVDKETFCSSTRPGRTWGPLSLLYHGYLGSIPEGNMVQWLVRDIGCQRPSRPLTLYVETNDTQSETG